MLWIIFDFTVACLLMALVTWEGMTGWRRAAVAHWTERARLLYPARATETLNIFLLPFGLVLFHATLSTHSYWWLIANGFAGLMGALLGCFPSDREIRPGIKLGSWCQRVAAGWAIRFGRWLVFYTALFSMPAQMGWGMTLVTGGYLGFHFLIQWGLVFKILRLIKHFKPAGPRLLKIVQASTARMPVKVSGIWQCDEFMANAFALRTTRELIFTDRLLEVCTDEELDAICAHELAHLMEPKTVLLGRLLGSLINLPFIFILPLYHRLGVAGFLICYGGRYVIQRFSRQIARHMEKRADQVALTEQTGEGVYARALEKLYCANEMPAVIGTKRQIHPELYDRLLAAGISPNYPRPAKPDALSISGWAVVIFVFAMVLIWLRTTGWLRQ